MDKLYLIIFYIFQFFVKNIPDFLMNPVLDFIAWLIYVFDKKHRKIIKINLDFAYNNEMNDKEKTRIVKKCYKNLVYFLADFVKNQGITKDELSKKVTFKNKEVMENALKENKKIILITAHYGNWELIALCIGAFFDKVTGVGRALESKTLNNILKKNREQFDIKMLDKQGAMKGMIKALKRGRILGLLVDQNTAENEGVLVNFFAKKTRQTHSVALLARKMNAVILPIFITTDDYKNYLITFYDIITPQKSDDIDKDIQKLTQAQADAIEKAIRKKPDEWFWFHKRWKNQYEELYQ
jgi:KDO2-lipid IV(A) lauroyltransferase